jgi:hypothetical protein
MFLDIPLVYELILIVTLIVLIAWLTGRIFCKAREHQAYASNKSLKVEKKYLTSGLNEKDNEVQHLSKELRNYQKQVDDLAHQHDLDENRINLLNKEKEQLKNNFQIEMKEMQEKRNNLINAQHELQLNLQKKDHKLVVFKNENERIQQIYNKKVDENKEMQDLVLSRAAKGNKKILESNIDLIEEQKNIIQEMQDKHTDKYHQLNLAVQKKDHTLDEMKQEYKNIEKKYTKQISENKKGKENEKEQYKKLLNEKQRNNTLRNEKESLEKALEKQLEEEKIRLGNMTSEQKNTMQEMQEMQDKHTDKYHQLNLVVQKKDHTLGEMKQEYEKIEKKYTKQISENKKSKENEKEQYKKLLNEKQLNNTFRKEKESFEKALKKQLEEEKIRLGNMTSEQKNTMGVMQELQDTHTDKYHQLNIALQQKEHALAGIKQESKNIERNYNKQVNENKNRKENEKEQYKKLLNERRLNNMLRTEKIALEKEKNNQNDFILKLRREKKILKQVNASQAEEITQLNEEEINQLAITNEKLSLMLQ